MEIQVGSRVWSELYREFGTVVGIDDTTGRIFGRESCLTVEWENSGREALVDVRSVRVVG